MIEGMKFNMCDRCDEIDGDYEKPMYYDADTGCFKCERGHYEDPHQHFRNTSEEVLLDYLMQVLKHCTDEAEPTKVIEAQTQLRTTTAEEIKKIAVWVGVTSDEKHGQKRSNNAVRYYFDNQWKEIGYTTEMDGHKSATIISRKWSKENMDALKFDRVFV